MLWLKPEERIGNRFFGFRSEKSVAITGKICYTHLGFIYVSDITVISEHL